MRHRAAASVVLALVAIPATCHGQHARVPVSYTVGWETVVYPVGPAAPGSEVATVLGDGAVVSYAIDRYWLVFPFWNRNGGFVVSKPFATGKTPDEVWGMKDQSPAALAQVSGLPPERFRRPWPTYVPFGWPIVASVIVLVQLFSGPSPKKRFARVWAEPRYRAAISLMLGTESVLPLDLSTPIILEKVPPDPEAMIDELLSALTQEGLPRRASERDLLFAFRYLVDNGHVVIVDPGRWPGTEEEPVQSPV